MGRRFLFVLVVSFFSAIANSSTVHVPADMPTIQAGINAAVNGDTVLVAPGTYVESINFQGKRIVVRSASDALSTIITNEFWNNLIYFNNGETRSSVLEGFTLLGGSIGVYCINSSPTIRRNLLKDQTIENWGALVLDGSSTALVENNTIINAANGAIACYSPGAIIKNNIIAYNSHYGLFGICQATYNDVYGNYPDYERGAFAGIGSISIDPLFESNFTLMGNSPCIDAGDPDPAYNDPNGSRNDMGALPSNYQYPIASNINFGNPLYPHICPSLSPEISWHYYDTMATMQYQYEIEVGIDNDWNGPEIWASGPVISSVTQASYSGLPLNDNSTYYLRIRLNDGVQWGEWSHSVFFTHTRRIIHIPADYSTIQSGIIAGVDGDTVLVSSGEYYESIDFSGKEIVVKSADGPLATIITNSSSTNLVVFNSGETRNAILEGFTLQGGHMGIYCNDAAPTIRRNLLKDQTITDWAAIVLEGASPALVENNTIVNAANGGLSTFSIRPPAIKNNIIAFSAFYGIHRDGDAAEPELSYNDAYGNPENYQGIADSGIGSISVDPLFGSDFTLTFNSRCIDAGDPDSTYNDPNGSRNDMGALPTNYQYPFAFNINFGNPLDPHFSSSLIPLIAWQYYDLKSTTQYQYEIEVGFDSDWNVFGTWASGQILSGDTQAIYSGLPLNNNSIYYLRIRLNNGIQWGEWQSTWFLTHVGQSIGVPSDAPTIQAGIDMALDGDTVLVAPGIYLENISLGNNIIVLKSENGPTETFIRSTQIGQNVISIPPNLSGARISGFTIDGAIAANGILISRGSSVTIDSCILDNNRSILGGGIYCLGNQTVVNYCIFKSNASTGKGGGILVEGDSISIGYCRFYGNSAQDGGGAISIKNASGIIIRESVMYDNFVNDDYGGILYAEYSNNIKIINNSIIANRSRGFGSGVTFVGIIGFDVRNNIIAFNVGDGLYATLSTTGSVEYNDFFENYPVNVTGESPAINNIYMDPHFVDTSTQNFALVPTSPCVDAGDPNSQYNDPDGSRNDMGAFWPLNVPAPLNLKIEPNMSGIYVGSLTPIFRWQFYDTAKTEQEIYEIEVGIDSDLDISEMWATGQIYGHDSSVVYAGLPLTENATYYVRLRVNNGLKWSDWIGKSFIPIIPTTIEVPKDQPTIQAAINAASDFDTVLVGDGVYHESPDFDGKKIVVRSADGPLVTIITDASSTNLVVFNDWETRNSVLEGFTLLGGHMGIYCYNSSPTIRRNLLKDQTYTGWAALVLDGVSAALVENNTIVNAANGAIACYSPQAIIKNNIIAFNSNYGIFGSCEATYNDVYSNALNYDNGTMPGLGSISLNPLFEPDYALTSESPCIDAGDPDTLYNDPDGSRNDMGAIPFAWKLGDANGDRAVDVIDITFLINFLYRHGTAPNPLKVGDINGSCTINALDITYLINYLYKSGNAPKVGCE